MLLVGATKFHNHPGNGSIKHMVYPDISQQQRKLSLTQKFSSLESDE
jgi:hypothetical protein